MNETAPRYTKIGGLDTVMGKSYAFKIFLKLPNGKYVNAYAMPNRRRQKPDGKMGPEYELKVIDNPDNINERTGEPEISPWNLPHDV